MPQIFKGDTFTNGEQVTGARLNQLVDSATLSAGAILDQGAMTANTVAATDSVLLYDLSATALRKPTVSDVLNSNLPIRTSAISGGTAVDLVLTPAAGQKVDVAGAFEAESANVVNALTVGGVINGTGAIKIATGTQAERPASPVAGHIRFNTTSGTLEVYSGTEWINGNTSGSANFTGLVNAEDFTIRNKNLLLGIYDPAVYSIVNAGYVAHAYTQVSYAYFETSVTHTKTADEIWNIGFSFSQSWLSTWGDTNARNYTLELKLDDGTSIGTIETKTFTPYYYNDNEGGTVIPVQDVNVSFSRSIGVGVVFTGKKLRVYYKWTAGVWYTPNTNGGTGIAGTPTEPIVATTSRTLTINKSLVSNYP
jgi:hypothetical protein